MQFEQEVGLKLEVGYSTAQKEKTRLNNISVNGLQSYWIQCVWILFDAVLAMKLSALESKHRQKPILDQFEAKNCSNI